MKKAFYLLLVFSLSIGFVSCGSDDDDNTPPDNSDKYFQSIEGSWIIENEIPEAQYQKTYKFYKDREDKLVDFNGLWDGEVVIYTKLCSITKDSIIMNPYGGSLHPTRDVSRYAYKLENNVLTLTVKASNAWGQTSTRFVRQ